ncbi:putative ABC transporter, permease protein [Desulfonema limicola]|uniref:ABC transporter, permease protein n=1 Tax=Desulfonema limicola TaxID=45656 RepID=A0A975GJ32_9BACT|nr:iron ABC transporter permease [Desulfonema limicola]QTA83096.1 putative ABC transporter, permease protein [Desulfonema limicola]
MIANTGCADGIIGSYNKRIKKKWMIFSGLLVLIILLAVFAITQGGYTLSLAHVFHSLMGKAQGTADIVIWNIRMPRIIAALVSGWGLGISGLAIQTLLKNPLGSPFTLGISQGAAFGAAFAIVLSGTGSMAAFHLCSVTFFAFAGAMIATAIILMLARIRKMSPESVILAGVALSSLFSSGTILIQFFATETELASVVFWTFGDVTRSSWKEIGLTFLAASIATVWLIFNRWNLNALASGDETAKGLGVETEKIRLWGMFLSAFVAAMITAFHGVIAFLGLIAPHIARRLTGGDHRLLLPFTSIIGAFLLLMADTAGRVLIGSGALPVGVLTSFMGAPLFLFLLIKGYRK